MTRDAATPAAQRRGRGGGATHRGWNIALWVVQGVTAAAMLGTGVSTVAGADAAVQMFVQIGLGDWLRYLTGVLQIAAAVGLLVPRLAGLTGLALVGMWLIATGAHLFGLPGGIVPAVVFLALSAVVAWGRRDSTAELYGRILSTAGSRG